MQSSWVSLILRVVLALYFAAAALSVLRSGLPDGDVATWLPVHAGARAWVYVVALAVVGLVLALGVATSAAAVAVSALLLLVHLEWLAKAPFYNATEHLLPFVAAALVVVALSDADALGLSRWRRHRAFSAETRWSVVTLVLRLFLGAIFVRQALHTVAGDGILAFAERVYVAPLRNHWMPGPLLWVAGVLNPPVQLVGGLLFAAGLRTRWSGITLGVFLLTILFGHLLADAFDRGPDVHAYAGANLAVVLAVLIFEHRGNRFSVDALLATRGGSRPSTTSAPRGG